MVGDYTSTYLRGDRLRSVNIISLGESKKAPSIQAHEGHSERMPEDNSECFFAIYKIFVRCERGGGYIIYVRTRSIIRNQNPEWGGSKPIPMHTFEMSFLLSDPHILYCGYCIHHCRNGGHNPYRYLKSI